MATSLPIAYGEVLRRNELFDRGLSPSTLKAAVQRQDLARVLPSIYTRGPLGQIPYQVLVRAATLYADGRAAIACASAAAHWQVLAEPPRAVHLNCERPMRVRSTPRCIVHQYALTPDDLCAPGELLVVRRELAVVQAFGCLGERAGQAMILDATQRGTLRPEDVVPYVGDMTKGRNTLLHTLSEAASGSHSLGELNMIFDALVGVGLPAPKRQYRLVLPDGRVIIFDGAYVKAKVGLEYDGIRTHFNADARNADIARDGDAATMGWLILHATSMTARARRAWAHTVRRTVELRGGF